MVVNSQLMMPTVHVEQRESFDTIYISIIENTVKLIGNDASKLASIMNVRTGTICHTFKQGIAFSINVGDKLPFSMLRKFYPKTAAAEAAWFIMGTQDSSWIQKYCPIWDAFTEADGKTVEAAYGYRWRKHFGRDQLADLITALFVNPSDRRTVLCAWDPGDDGLMHQGTKNVPCPFAMTYNIVDGELMMSYFIRSSDLYVGLPYDVYCTAFVMDAIRCELRLRARQTISSNKPTGIIPEADLERLTMLSNLTNGTMTVTLGNPHMYDNHVELAKESLDFYKKHANSYRLTEIGKGQPMTIPLPGWALSEIEANPDAYVEAVGQAFQKCVKSDVSQRPGVAK